jgi:hypothetical protein
VGSGASMSATSTVRAQLALTETYAVTPTNGTKTSAFCVILASSHNFS